MTSSVVRLLPQYTSARPSPGATRLSSASRLSAEPRQRTHRHREVVAYESGDPLDWHRRPRLDAMSSRTRGRRGRRECADRRTAARGDRLAESAVVGPEVVTPARDAVRLVDHEAIDGQPAEAVEEPRCAETFGRQIQEAELARRGGSQRVGAGRGAHLAVQARGRHPERVETCDLVDHQRDERRDDDGELRRRRSPVPSTRCSFRSRSVRRTGRRERASDAATTSACPGRNSAKPKVCSRTARARGEGSRGISPLTSPA